MTSDRKTVLPEIIIQSQVLIIFPYNQYTSHMNNQAIPAVDCPSVTQRLSLSLGFMIHIVE